MFKRGISVFKKRLTTVGSEEPLNKLSLAVIILLDLFVLAILFGGLEDHTRQLTTLGEYMPATTRQVFIDQSWSPSTRIAKLQPLALSDRTNYSIRHNSIFDEAALRQMHPLCRAFYEKVKVLSEDKALLDLFADRSQKINELNQVRSDQNRTKKAYDTALLERIAAKQSVDTAAVATRSQTLTVRIEELTGEVASIDRNINDHPGVQELWHIISPENQNRQELVDDYRRFERWYPFKEFFWQLLFLLPIFALFYVWSGRSVKKGNRVQTLVASHLLVVAALPILFKLIELAMELIPDKFFKSLFKFLKSLHLIAIWHYLVIIGAVALGLFLIFLIQKKVFSRQRMMQKRLAKGACIRCSKQLPAGASSCPFCGTLQSAACAQCNQKTPIGGMYCVHCGQLRSNTAAQ